MELQDELYSDMYTDNSSLFSETHRSLLDFSALVNILFLFKGSTSVVIRIIPTILSETKNIVYVYKVITGKKIIFLSVTSIMS